MRAHLPAGLLAGRQPYRARFLEIKGIVQKSRSPDSRGSGGGARRGDLSGKYSGRLRLLQALQL
jgi:hypothetical protein